MSKFIDLSGKKFGKLTVINKNRRLPSTNSRAYWNCICKCGKRVKVKGNSLKSGHTKSCSKSCSCSLVGKTFGNVKVVKNIGIKYQHPLYKCLCNCGNFVKLTSNELKRFKKPMCYSCRHEDLTGRKVNKLTVISKCRKKRKGRTFWKCKCLCGKIKNVEGSALKSKIIISCGCHRKYIRSGNRSNWWKHGKSFKNLKKRQKDCREHRWRRKVLKNNEYICQCCGFVSENKKGLVAHHLYSYVDNYRKRNKEKNGIVLCKSCHIKFHKKYGMGKNNPQQFYYFKRTFKLDKNMESCIIKYK